MLEFNVVVRTIAAVYRGANTYRPTTDEAPLVVAAAEAAAAAQCCSAALLTQLFRQRMW